MTSAFRAALHWKRIAAATLLIALILPLAAQVPSAGPGRLAPVADGADTATRTQAPDWQLRWSDEFDRAGAPDPEKWDYEHGRVRNREAQVYTADRRENARVEGAHLVITARRGPDLRPAFPPARSSPGRTGPKNPRVG